MDPEAKFLREGRLAAPESEQAFPATDESQRQSCRSAPGLPPGYTSAPRFPPTFS
jgi:hypothetical protein